MLAKSSACRRQLVLGNGGNSCKFSNRSLHAPPFGTVLKEVGWRWLPPSQWFSVKEGAWVTVAAAQQAMTYGGCHCQVIVTTPVRAEGKSSRAEAPGSLCNSHCAVRSSSSSHLGRAAFCRGTPCATGRRGWLLPGRGNTTTQTWRK